MQVSIMDLLQATDVAVQDPIRHSQESAGELSADAFAAIFAELRDTLLSQAEPGADEDTAEEVAIEVPADERVALSDATKAALMLAQTSTPTLRTVSPETPEDGVELTELATSGVDVDTADELGAAPPTRGTTTTNSAAVDTKATGDGVPVTEKADVTRSNARPSATAAPVQAVPASSDEPKPPSTFQVVKPETETGEGSTSGTDGKSVVTESARVAKVTPAWTPPPRLSAGKSPVDGEAVKETPNPTTAAKTTTDVSEQPEAHVTASASNVEDVEGSNGKSIQREFPTDLRVARLVREVNPELTARFSPTPPTEPVAPTPSVDPATQGAVLTSVEKSTTTFVTADHVSETTTTTTTTRTPLADLGDTVVRQVKFLGVQQNRTVTIRLIPETLGEVQVEVKSVGGETSVQLTSANATVRDTLESQVHLLRDALSREGVDVQRVHVTSSLSTTTQAHAGNQDTPGQQQSQWSEARHSGGHQQRGGQRFQEGHASPEPRDRATAKDGSLNLFV